MSEIDTESNVLIVDDSDAIREILKTMLTSLGYKSIHEAQDGEDALTYLHSIEKSELPQFIICDQEMPNKRGIDLLKELQKDDSFKSIPFIAVSAYVDVSLAVDFKENGAHSYLVKPVQMDQLKECIAEAKSHGNRVA